MISALEYAIANFGSVATLVATTPDQNFTPASAWFDLDTESAHSASASRIILRSDLARPRFVANIAVQYFSFEDADAIRLGDLDTTLDIGALPASTILSHDLDLDGYMCIDEGTYAADGHDLRVRRVQVAFRTPADGKSALSIFTGTTTVDQCVDISQEIIEMEERWLKKTIQTSGGNQRHTSPEDWQCG